MKEKRTIRTTRTLKVRDVELSPETRDALANLFKNDAGYQALLDVMERACVEMETALFNTDTGNPDEVLGGHAVCKAMWKFFVYVQKQVYSAHMNQSGEEQGAKPPSLEEVIQGVQ